MWFLYFFKAHFWKELLSFITFTQKMYSFCNVASRLFFFLPFWWKMTKEDSSSNENFIDNLFFFVLGFFVWKYKSWLQQDLQQKWIRKAFFGLFQVIVFYLILSAKLSFFTQDSTLDKNCIKCKWNCFL